MIGLVTSEAIGGGHVISLVTSEAIGGGSCDRSCDQ